VILGLKGIDGLGISSYKQEDYTKEKGKMS